jgi:hypothetical protein
MQLAPKVLKRDEAKRGLKVDTVITYTIQAAAPATVVCLGWWLRGKFQDVKDDARNNLSEHELKDQGRHEENIQRFARLETKVGK